LPEENKKKSVLKLDVLFSLFTSFCNRSIVCSSHVSFGRKSFSRTWITYAETLKSIVEKHVNSITV
jgi:hypothetical protein